MNGKELKFEKQTNDIWVAKYYNGTYSRFYHVTKYPDGRASLKIFGSNRKSEIMYKSVSAAMKIAVQEHGRWLSSVKKGAKQSNEKT